jgi:dTDP-4-amino-4,6-dideoxygalactose transaminase
LSARKRIAQRYDDAIAERNDISTMPRVSWATGNSWMYTLRTDGEADAESLLAHFAQHKIGARSFWRSLSAQAPYSGMPKLLTGVSATISGRTVSLPCSSNLTDDEQYRVIEALDSWSGNGTSGR